jgi:outer membrane murein-binding lipoprotein Lpp
MTRLKNRKSSVWLASTLILGGLSLSGCATEKYVDEHIAVVNSRIDGVDAKAQDAIQRADAAAAAAQAAAGDARTANERLDQLTGRVQSLEQRPMTMPKAPRN